MIFFRIESPKHDEDRMDIWIMDFESGRREQRNKNNSYIIMIYKISLEVSHNMHNRMSWFSLASAMGSVVAVHFHFYLY